MNSGIRVLRDRAAPVALAAVLALAPTAGARGQEAPQLNLYGVSGLIDMPSALSQPDGRVSATASHFSGITRGTLTFQITPRLEGSFRYAGLADLNYSGYRDYYDRSFDLAFRLLDEGRVLPAVKLGLQDFAGTGLFSGEYLVATKTLTPSLRVTAGLGWGRLGSYGDIGAPFGARPAANVGRGGKPSPGQWFRGPAAPFGGVEWLVNDRLTLTAEYSSDAYDLETGGSGASAILDRKSPLNFGASYRLGKRATIGGYYMYGSAVGVSLSLVADPYDPPVAGSTGPAPLPVLERPARSGGGAYDTGWTARAGVAESYTAQLAGLLKDHGLAMESLTLTGTTAELRLRNRRYDATAQAIGRAARAMTQILPASVETFRIVPSIDGLAASAVTLRRSDLEALEHAPDGAARLLERAQIGDAGRVPAAAMLAPDGFPSFTWQLGPYVSTSYFDPDSPLRARLGLELSARYEPRPGLVFAGALRKKLAGNLDSSRRFNTSALPPVRSNAALYAREGDPDVENLYAAYYFRPGDNLYGRVTAGYLERMFGGVSAEVLWKPVDSRLAFGAEVNMVRQRAYGDLFGFRDYDVLNGHVSAYYEFGNGFLGQVDVGRYLAGDVGATFTLDREFRNGWKLGAFATFTDASAAAFGEGSFDKGIRLEVPLSWFTGTPSRTSAATTIRPVSRDGGARLKVPGRLYESVRGYHRQVLEDQWGRVWR